MLTKNETIKTKLIHYSMMGIFTTEQLNYLKDCLLYAPDFSLEEILFMKQGRRMKNALSLLERVGILEKTQDTSTIMEQYQKRNVHVVTILDEEYPPSLKEIYQPPVVLYYQGDWRLTRRRRLGIVGSRNVTEYGKQVLAKLLPPLIKEHVTTVSGLAAGIDQEVHTKTMELEGNTIAIIGTGIDRFYPRPNQGLQEKIGKEQLLISEYPLGTPPKKHHFPMRNRLIAGLSHGVLVVEAKQRSGSLITANVALQENREVFAVPGNILYPAYQGTNELIRSGAKVVLSEEDIFEELQVLWLLKNNKNKINI